MGTFAIEGKDISKTINRQLIIDQMSMKIPFNSIVLIEGKNGSGKSITLKMLAKILKPSNGRLDVNGSISYAPDHLPTTINLTVKEYLDFIERISKNTPTDITMKGLINQFNLTPFLNKSIKACSKGTQQKVNLIQCLVRQADIYIMDEPFSGLDKQAIAQLKLILQQLRQSATIVLTSHEEALNDTFVTHQFNLENKRLSVHHDRKQSRSMLIKTSETLNAKQRDMLKRFEAEIIDHVQIKVNVSESNELIALLIQEGYFIEEVREDNENGTY